MKKGNLAEGRITLPIGEETVTLYVEISFSDASDVCHYCQTNQGNLIRVEVTTGETQNERTARYRVEGAFCNRYPVCVACYDKWQAKSHETLREKFHGDWVRENSPAPAVAEKKPVPFHETALELLNGESEAANEFAAIIKGFTGGRSHDCKYAVPELVAAMLIRTHVPEKARPALVTLLGSVLLNDEDMHTYDAVKKAMIELGGDLYLHSVLCQQQDWTEADASKELERVRGYMPVEL